MTINNIELEAKLYRVQKPAQYTGGELGSIVKENAELVAALSYPDLYEIGMSNNGIQILYHVANKIDKVACERVFAPAKDLEDILREEGLPLFTLESRTPLSELDLLGFNLSHELLYSNVLLILDLGHIPLLRNERTENSPIIIAGGSAASNPFPMLDFIDAFFIGDGEDGFAEILESLLKSKREGYSRQKSLELLGSIEGVLVSQNYKFEYDGMRIISIEGPQVKRRVFNDPLPVVPLKPVVPNIRVSQGGRAIVDVTRGCFNLCKFCLAGYYDLPYRKYDCAQISPLIMEVLNNTGYNELTLASLSIGDYAELRPLLSTILPELTENGVSVSLPSLRVDANTIPVIESVSDLRRSSLTFAVESGAEELRALAHKKVREDELLYILDHVLNNGWNIIKLYFMLGLPGNEDVDEALAIIELLNKIIALGNRKKEIHATISPFIPKPHTPFQRAAQMDEDYFFESIRRIKQSMPRFVKIKNHNVKASMLEGLLARGDTRFGPVILNAYTRGCRFDSWSEHVKYDLWEQALNEEMPSWKECFFKRADIDTLPWQTITTGREKLIEVMGRRSSYPMSCGQAAAPEAIDMGAIAAALEGFTRKYNVAKTLRIRFAKTGSARFIPHIDFVEIIKRALRMARFPVAFTQGFNKRERLTMSLALPLGIESAHELCDVALYESLSETINPVFELTKCLPSGIEAVSVEEVESTTPSLSLITAVSYDVIVTDDSYMQKVLQNLRAEISFTKQTKKGEKSIAFCDVMLSFTIKSSDTLSITALAGMEGSLRIDYIMIQLANTDYSNVHLFKMKKTGQYRIDADRKLQIF